MFDGYGDLFSDSPLGIISFDEETTVENNTPGKNSKIKIGVSIGDENFNAVGPRDAMLNMLDLFIAARKADFARVDEKIAKTKDSPF